MQQERAKTRGIGALVLVATWAWWFAGMGWAAEKGLVLHLPFDGNVEAAAGKDVGPVRAKGNPRFVKGRHGQAVSLTDGAHLIVPVPPTIKKGEFSISFWVKPLWHPSDNLAHTIIHMPDKPEKTDAVGWAPGQFIVSKGWSEAITPNYFYGVTASDVVKRHLKPGRWTHCLIVFSVSGAFSGGYVDGEGNRRPLRKAKPPVAHGDVMWLGERADNPVGGASGDIVMDDLKIYNRAVAASEIPTVARATFPPPFDYLSVGNTFELAKAVETPHVTWAKPLSGGPVKALCIAEGLRAREIAELAQRLDMDPIVLTAPRPMAGLLKTNRHVYDRLGPKIEAALKAGDVRCILVGAFGWNLILESARAAILDAVKAGAGLVLSSPRCVDVGNGHGRVQVVGAGVWAGWRGTPDGAAMERLVGRLDRPDEDYLVNAIPWRDVAMFGPTWRARTPRALFRGARLGKGRVLVYDIFCETYHSTVCLTPTVGYMGPIEFSGFDYDYCMGAAARAVLWAAGRDPNVRIDSVAFHTPNTSLAPDRVSAGTAGEWVIEVRNTGAAGAKAVVTLTARTRDPDPPFEVRRTVTLKPGVTRLTVPQTVEAVGKTYGDVRLFVGNKVADWFTATVESRPGNPRFVDVTADQPSYSEGEGPRITARFKLTKYAYATGHTVDVRWRLYDGYQRLVGRGTHTCTCGPDDQDVNASSWRLAPLCDASLGYRVIADLVYRGKVTDRRAIDLWRRRDGADDFVFVTWGGGGGPVQRLATLVMRDHYGLGCGSVVGRGGATETFRRALEWMARNNIRPWIVDASDIGRNTDAQKRRMPDLADPGWLNGMRTHLAEVARMARTYSPLFYGLGDETRVGPPDYRASGHEQEAFRTMLQARYKTIKKLNKAWGAEYKAWPQVAIPDPGSPNWKTGKPVPRSVIADFRQSLYADAIKTGMQGARSVDPNACVGVEGIFGLIQAWTGQDYWKMAQRSTLMGQYCQGMQMNMCRSFQKPGDLLQCWYNYTHLDRQYSLYGPWQFLLRGGRAFGWYTTFEGSAYTALNPDFSPYVQFGWTMEELRPLLAGIGKLVLGMDRDDLGVAILHNQRNLDRCSPQFHSAMVTANLLEDLGIHHDWVHGDQIVARELTKRKLKVLFLPGQFHMSPEVAEAIRAHVAAGGALVADVVPADADGIKRYKKRPLADLFVSAKDMKGAMPPASEADVKAWASRVKTVGKGKTLLYGRYPTTYNRDRMKHRGKLMRAAVGNFLSACGVRSAVTVTPTDGTFLPRVVVTYRDGHAVYVATQREYIVADMSPREFAFTVPAKAHAYDVRAGKYLGHTDRAKLTIEVARGALVAFLPYKATSLEVEGLADTCRQGDTQTLRLRLAAEGAVSGHGVFRVEVREPAGQRVAPLCGKLRWTGGLADHDLAIAWNDPSGNWTMTVTDIATGVAARKRFRVKAGTP